MDGDNDFKYLCNPTDKDFEFQYDSKVYKVPAKSRKLFMSDVADHGAKRSFCLTDPVIDEDGNVLSTGNDIIQRCKTQEADVVNPINFHEPIMIEKSKDVAATASELMVPGGKPLRARGRKHEQSENVSGS